jgi:anti-anti-sigma factor
MNVEQRMEQVLLVKLSHGAPAGEELESALALTSRERSRHVVVDFSEVQVMTSGMLSQLMILERQLDAFDRRLVLCSVRAEVANVFQCVGLQGLFRFAKDQTTAFEWLTGLRPIPSQR